MSLSRTVASPAALYHSLPTMRKFKQQLDEFNELLDTVDDDLRQSLFTFLELVISGAPLYFQLKIFDHLKRPKPVTTETLKDREHELSDLGIIYHELAEAFKKDPDSMIKTAQASSDAPQVTTPKNTVEATPSDPDAAADTEDSTGTNTNTDTTSTIASAEKSTDNITRTYLLPIPTSSAFIPSQPQTPVQRQQPGVIPVVRAPTNYAVAASAVTNVAAKPQQPQQPQQLYTAPKISVIQFVDIIRQVSFIPVFEFAMALYSAQPSTLKDADGDVRKYLFHISRHTAVISGVAKVPVDGVSAGIFLFRIGAHSESVPESRFKTLTREYVTFLEHIEIRKHDGQEIRFRDKALILTKLESVDFPGGFTFPPVPEAREFSRDPSGRRAYDGKDTSANTEGDTIFRASPTINVRELHRRQLCVACRHYLRGMCYRGDSCNFCHNADHQKQLEESSSELRNNLPRAGTGPSPRARERFSD